MGDAAAAATGGSSFLDAMVEGLKRPAGEDSSGGSASPKKPRPNGPKGKENGGGNERKLILRSCKACLAGMRKADGESGRAFGYDKDTYEQKVLKKAKDS